MSTYQISYANVNVFLNITIINTLKTFSVSVLIAHKLNAVDFQFKDKRKFNTLRPKIIRLVR